MASVRRIVTACLLSFLAFGAASAQNSGRSVSVQIVATVPVVLSLSLDFSADAGTTVAGYLPDAGSLIPVTEQGRRANAGNAFEIREGARVALGNARLVSNISSSYSVQVHSANGGALVDERGTKVTYQLTLGDRTISAREGSFQFAASGKSTRAGTALPVGLSISSLPSGAAGGFYTDSLFFSVSAN